MPRDNAAAELIVCEGSARTTISHFWRIARQRRQFAAIVKGHAVSGITELSKFFSSHPLTRDAPLGAWARFAAWQVRSRVQSEVIFPWIEGQRLAVRRGMLGATGNIYVGLHEFTDMMLPLHFLREDDHFLDVGANIGSYTVLAAGVKKATVWAFEPDPQTARALQRNIELNGLQNRVTVHQVAIGDRDGEVAFTRGLGTVNRVATNEASDVQTVPLRCLDSLVGSQRPTMIKMDVEGYEEAAIRGAQGILACDSLKVIELETVSPEVEATFTKHGFKQAHYDPFGRKLTVPVGDVGVSNSVYIRDWDFVASRLATAPPVKVLGRSI